MIQAAKKMKRITIKKIHLYRRVIFFCTLITIFLLVWTIVDPPLRREQISLEPDLQNDRGETIVKVTFYCESEKYDLIWRYTSLGWQCVLMISATVLAFQTRNIRRDLNESRTLGMMIYSHFVFIILRCVTYILEGSIERNILEACRSLIYSLDVLVALNIYFTPKMIRVIKDKYFRKENDARSANQSGGKRRSIQISGISIDESSQIDFSQRFNPSRRSILQSNMNAGSSRKSNGGDFPLSSLHEGYASNFSNYSEEDSARYESGDSSYGGGKNSNYYFDSDESTRPRMRRGGRRHATRKDDEANNNGPAVMSAFLQEVEEEVDVDNVSLSSLQRILGGGHTSEANTKAGKKAEPEAVTLETAELDMVSSTSS